MTPERLIETTLDHLDAAWDSVDRLDCACRSRYERCDRCMSLVRLNQIAMGFCIVVRDHTRFEVDKRSWPKTVLRLHERKNDVSSRS